MSIGQVIQNIWTLCSSGNVTSLGEGLGCGMGDFGHLVSLKSRGHKIEYFLERVKLLDTVVSFPTGILRNKSLGAGHPRHLGTFQC